MTFPLSGKYTGTLVASLKVAVFVFGSNLPCSVAISFPWEAITAFGLTSSLITKAASVVKTLPMFNTANVAWNSPLTTSS
jgi:hypothetical protein